MPSSADLIDLAFESLLAGTNRDPFAVLGPHRIDQGEQGIVVRAYHPAARSIDLRLGDSELLPMQKRDPVALPGLFEVHLPAPVHSELASLLARNELASRPAPRYRLRLTFPGDAVVELDDPYRFGRV